MGETQKADPHSRRAAVAIVGGGTIVGVILITVARRFRPEFEAWLKEDLSDRLIFVVVTMTILTTGPLLGLAAYVWHLGRRVLRAERYPPPGLRVIHDTPVVTGPAARRRGRWLQLYAVVLGLAALLLVFFIWRLFAALRLPLPEARV